jgi:tripartite-type tricarboxylate transporter receptor subunit TctC
MIHPPPAKRLGLHRFLFGAVIGMASLQFLSSPAQAQTPSYPNKPIRLVVPFPAGSATDSMARALAAAVSGSIGQNVVVENKAGADGMIAASEKIATL